jgi:hypothetical protein
MEVYKRHNVRPRSLLQQQLSRNIPRHLFVDEYAEIFGSTGKVSSSNLDQETEYSVCGICGFAQSTQVNVRMVPTIRLTDGFAK